MTCLSMGDWKLLNYKALCFFNKSCAYPDTAGYFDHLRLVAVFLDVGWKF